MITVGASHSDLRSTTVTLHGTFSRDENIHQVRFYYWREERLVNDQQYTICSSIYFGGCNHIISPVSADLTDLWPGHVYYYCLQVAGEESGPVRSEYGSFETNMVVTNSASVTNIQSSSVTFRGQYTKDNECISGIRFRYWKEGFPEYFTDKIICSSTTACETISSPFSINETGLDPDTMYCWRLLMTVENYSPDINTEIDRFKTGTPEVYTHEPTLVGNRIATLNGETIPGMDELVERGFQWKIPEQELLHEEIVDLNGDNYSKKLEDLIPAKLYIFKAYGEFILYETSTHYKIYGEWEQFTTTNIVPIVTTQISTDIEAMSVVGNGTIVEIGDLEEYCTARGFNIKYNFVGNLEEYNAWKGHGFSGSLTFDPETNLYSGVLEKSYEESGTFSTGAFNRLLSDLVNDKVYFVQAKAENSVGWGYGNWLEVTTDELLLRKACTIGVWTILLCAYVNPIPSGSVIKRRGFRWGIYETAQEYDIHEDGDFSASAIIGPVDTISFVNSADDNVYDTIVDSAKGFVSAGFVAGKFIDVSATGELSLENEGQFKIISVSGDGGTITVNVRNTLVSEGVTGVTIVDLFALYIVDLDPETDYYSVAYVAIEDSVGSWTVQEGDVAMATTIVNPFDFEGYDKVEFYKPEREQNYKKITRKIEAEIISEQQYIEKAGGRRFLDIKNHLIQTKANAVVIGTNYRDRFQEIKSLMSIEYPTPAPFQREDTLDIGFGRIKFKEDDKGVVNFMLDGEGLMLFRYRMVMLIRKIDMGYTISKEDVDYMATMELEEA